MGRRGKSAKKARSKQKGEQDEALQSAPHSFVINRGPVGKNVQELIHDVRRVLEPYTASKLKTRKKNVLKDFVSIAGVFHVSHILMFSKTDVSVNLRIARTPHGPTLTFKVMSYTLSRDVINSLKKPNMEPKQFQHHPLLVMNNMTGEGGHFKLVASVFQNMFPSININKVKLNDIRRCLLLNYDQENETLEFRHYNIRAVPAGMSRSVKKLVTAKIPDMSRYEDVSEYVMKSGQLSESEGELDGEEVVLPQEMSSRGNIKSAKSAIRLTEIGPRMTLQLMKVEEGISSGDVLYHRLVEKTEVEIASIKAMHEKKRLLKAQRRSEQQARIEKIEMERQELRRKSQSGSSKTTEDALIEGEAAASSDDDDREYYREEVGVEPESELFPTGGKKRKYTDKSFMRHKRPKLSGPNKNFPQNKKAKYPDSGQGNKSNRNPRKSDDKHSKFSKKKHGGVSKLGGKFKTKKFKHAKKPNRK